LGGLPRSFRNAWLVRLGLFIQIAIEIGIEIALAGLPLQPDSHSNQVPAHCGRRLQRRHAAAIFRPVRRRADRFSVAQRWLVPIPIPISISISIWMVCDRR